MTLLISGHNPERAMRSHEDRLREYNRERQVKLRQWATPVKSRTQEQMRAAMAKRTATSCSVIDDVTALERIRELLANYSGCELERLFRVGVDVLQRAVAGAPIKHASRQRIEERLRKPFPPPQERTGRAGAKLVAAVRAVLAEEDGSRKSAAARLGVGFDQITRILSDRPVATFILDRIAANITAKPDGWRSGKERHQDTVARHFENLRTGHRLHEAKRGAA